jgi:hypothetical protein
MDRAYARRANMPDWDCTPAHGVRRETQILGATMLRPRGRTGSLRRLFWPSLATLAVAAAGVAVAAPDASFDGLLGAWSGSGQVRYQSGDTEGIRCTAYYTGGGPKLGLAIRCKSASNDIEIRGALTHQGEKVSGTWEERTFNASGQASGRMAAGRMNLSIEGGGFSGTMSVSYSGTRQTVAITTQGIPMKSVNVTLTKS